MRSLKAVLWLWFVGPAVLWQTAFLTPVLMIVVFVLCYFYVFSSASYNDMSKV